MYSLKKIYHQAGRHPVIAAILITILAALVLFLVNQTESKPAQQDQSPALPVVKVTTAQDFAGASTVSLLGQVKSASQAAITTQRAGQLVQVNVTLGQSVRAGQVLATLENAPERAAVVQAQGRYDAAMAAREQARLSDRQTNLGINQADNTQQSAQNTAINAYKAAYTTVNGIILNNIDTFFSDPIYSSVPGLRIDGLGQTMFLNNERVAYQQLLKNWQQSADTLNITDDLPAALAEAKSNVKRTVVLVDTFIDLFNRQDSNNGGYTQEQFQAFSSSFTGLRSSLIQSQSALEAAAVGLKNAQDASQRAQINTSVSALPAAEAQIKQALGALQSAQANYAKTVLRTPISGTVNVLNISAGDFVGSFVEVAQVANNEALEITAYANDKERAVLAVGDTVTIDNQYQGQIAQIAPAIDSATGKTQIRIAAENIDIKNGQTVTISKEIAATSSKTAMVSVPLSAVKFAATDGSVFTVVDGKLVEKPVELGTVRGSAVEIKKGLSSTDVFVVDARGLLAGAEVEVAK